MPYEFSHIRKFIFVFMDDILIYSKNLDDHARHLTLVFQTLKEHNLLLKRSKCSFAQSRLEYLGHIISGAGVSTDPTDPQKTEVIQHWPVPTNITELQGFLGLTGYYRKFVRGYGSMAKPLTTLLQQKQVLWTPAAQAAFDTLKRAMVTTPVLAVPDFTKQFCIETDACDSGIGAVLTLDGDPDSKALGIKNSKLSIYEKEFLAIMMAVDKWRSYLQRGPFIIKTDHKSLCNLDDQVLTTELQRKAMTKLVGLQFKYQYKKGTENQAADSLSRVGHLFSITAVSTGQPLCQPLFTYSGSIGSGTSCSADSYWVIRKDGKIWVGANAGLHTKLIQAFHSTPVGGHSGK